MKIQTSQFNHLAQLSTAQLTSLQEQCSDGAKGLDAQIAHDRWEAKARSEAAARAAALPAAASHVDAHGWAAVMRRVTGRGRAGGA